MRSTIHLAGALTLIGVGCAGAKTGGSNSGGGDAARPMSTTAVQTSAGCSDAVATSAPRLLGNARMSADDLTDFFHLSEGSEIFPLSWLRALRDDSGAKVFDHLDKYGLLPDPNDKDGLPVGMSAATTRDSALFDLVMFGFNCAACHVGQVQAEGKVFRVLGGPNLFDIRAFLQDFGGALKATVTDLGRLIQFIKDLHADPTSPQTLVEGAHPSEQALVASLPSLDALKAGAPASRDLAARIETLYAAEATRAPKPLGDGLVVQPTAATPTGTTMRASPVKKIRPTVLPLPAAGIDLPPTAAVKSRDANVIVARIPAETPRAYFNAFTGPELSAALKPQTGTTTGLEKDIAGLKTFAAPEQSLGVSQFLAELVDTLRLLSQRLQALAALAKKTVETQPGPGRVDAFMTAHNLLFSNDPPVPMTSPVDYPRIWNLGQMVWLHWDGNTTSILERNVGQALGLGAVFDPHTYASTIRISNIHRLEEIARKIDAPAWPFTAPDASLVAAGAVLYQSRCARCHDSDQGDVVEAGVVGTDRNRADSFAQATAAKQPFFQALDQTLTKIIARAFKDENVPLDVQKQWEPVPAKWRATDAYVERTLAGAWATAPYLHDGSVPTLDDLLSSTRPTGFAIGDRRLDVVRGGYCSSGTFAFDAGAGDAGNGNAGHAYGIDLDAGERRALVAYIETLH